MVFWLIGETTFARGWFFLVSVFLLILVILDVP